MPKKRCKKNKVHQSPEDKYQCKKCYQTDNAKEKLCKPGKS